VAVAVAGQIQEGTEKKLLLQFLLGCCPVVGPDAGAAAAAVVCVVIVFVCVCMLESMYACECMGV
jgi:hypothetical protein